MRGGRENGIGCLGGHGTFEGCEIVSNDKAGVCASKLSRPTLVECSIKGNGDAGVLWDESAGTVKTCDIQGNYRQGVVIQTKSSLTVENCDIQANSDVGLVILDQSNPTVRACRILDGLTIGIACINGLGIIEDCVISGNTGAGIVSQKGGG